MRRSAASVIAALVLLSTVALAAGPVNPAAGARVDADAVQVRTPIECAFPFTETDATGATVTVESDPDRVVALHASAAQTMWEIGARDEVVGMPVNAYTADLEGYRRPTDVVGADDFTTNVEAVVDLSPDLVLAPNVTPVDTVEQLRRAGVTVFYFPEATSIEDVYAKTLLIGRLTGNCAGATERVAWMRERIERVRGAVEDERRPTVVYPLGGGVVAGSDTFLHELVTAAGGRNVAAEAGVSGYGQLNAEVIVARDPQWLILNDGLPRSAVQMDAYNRTTAIREGQVVRLNPNYANQPAPRIVYPIEAVARALHPGAMAAANETATQVDGDPTTARGAGATASDGPETSAPGQSGFGVAAGLVAIVALLAATRRSG